MGEILRQQKLSVGEALGRDFIRAKQQLGDLGMHRTQVEIAGVMMAALDDAWLEPWLIKPVYEIVGVAPADRIPRAPPLDRVCGEHWRGVVRRPAPLGDFRLHVTPPAVEGQAAGNGEKRLERRALTDFGPP